MRLLILGGGGQVASELIERCAVDDVEAVALGRTQCDIRDEKSVQDAFRLVSPTVVVNSAAYTAVDLAESHAAQAFAVNRDGAMNLANACRSFHLPLVHLSTDYVFDGSKAAPYVEYDQPCPINVYGSSKHAGEDAIRCGTDEHVIIRTAWVYGRHGRNFLKTMLGLAKTRTEWNVVHDQQGNPTSTVDLAEALLAAARAADRKQAPWGTYHFTGSGDATWFEFAQEIVRAQTALTGLAPSISPITTDEYQTAARRPRNSRLLSDRFEATFGIRAASWQMRTHEAVHALLSGRTWHS